LKNFGDEKVLKWMRVEVESEIFSFGLLLTALSATIFFRHDKVASQRPKSE
jgi:hypothetical protein